MPCGILYPMVWGISLNSLSLIFKIICSCLARLFSGKATKVGLSPPNFPKLISQLQGIHQSQYFVTLLLDPLWTYFWKHYIYIYKKKTRNLVAKIWLPNFVSPDCLTIIAIEVGTWMSNYIPNETHWCNYLYHSLELIFVLIRGSHGPIDHQWQHWFSLSGSGLVLNRCPFY